MSGPLYVGGAVGLNNIAAGASTAGSMSQVYATGAVTGTGASPSAVGGLVGYNGGSITQSYWDSYTTGQASGVGSGGSSGVTAVTGDPAQSAAANYAFKQSAYGSFSFTGNRHDRLVHGRRPDPAVRPLGIPNHHHQRPPAAADGDKSRRQLHAGGQYRPRSSLAAVGGKYPGMWSSSGLLPIGNSSTKFTGSFDGQGGTISGLLINRPTTNYVGLFGYVDIGGTVQHVGLQNATVTGQNDTGALAGYNNGAITQAYAAGTVSGAGLVGGLVGVNGGTITQTYATAAVSGTGNYVGGLWLATTAAPSRSPTRPGR